ncbi:hypothetical protein GCM10010399_84570 [Dactylosporangium fulvum]|uniref:Right handed beta helix domain-containing protein n=1 Tax=Dactylosporangium fulvum TaxID=53359 RepID=A0ABY5VS23_9ACTN|nr:hypothetical protein [Dactylosporangium fulvum]UWP79985.1 hypothetical protein Dfulv_33125 [Dactylosporangium fulvum]
MKPRIERVLSDVASDLFVDEPPIQTTVGDIVAHGLRRRRARRRRRVVTVAAVSALAVTAATMLALRPAGELMPSGADPTLVPSASSVPSPAGPATGTPSPASAATPSGAGSTSRTGFRVGTMTFLEKPGLTVPKESLTPYAGPAVITGSYQQSNCVVTRQIRVEASGRLSLTNCWIRVNVGDDGTGMIGKAGRIELNHVLVDGSGSSGETLPVILAGGGKVTFSEFIGTTQNISVRGPAEIEWNHIHAPKGSTSGRDTRSYGLSVLSGGPVTIAHNSIDVTGAEGLGTVLNVVSDFGPIDQVRITDNTFMPGGSYAVYVRTDGYCRCGGVRNVQVIGNRWYGDADHRWGGIYGAFSVNDPASITAWSGNTLTKAGGAQPVPLPRDNPQP